MTVRDVSVCRGEYGEVATREAFFFWRREMRGVAAEALAVVSQIGTRLAAIIKNRHKAIPCGECKAAITRLNTMTVEQVEADRENTIADIASRAAAKAPKWWQRLAVMADQQLGTGHVNTMISGWLDEAIAAEISGQPPLQFPASTD